jgi:quercetin dioxygenase-like cupin family protein
MKIPAFPFETFDWNRIPKEEHKGVTGTAYWQVRFLDNIRVRRVEYSAGYFADHWCKKGHVLFCTEGQMNTELEDGRQFTLTKGMCYLVGDDCEAHRSKTEEGCILFIVD